MADLSLVRQMYRPRPIPVADVGSVGPIINSVSTPPTVRASSANPYEAASYGRRGTNWNPTRLGPTSSLWATHDQMLARCRDEVRNNPWAASAVDNAESQWVGNGIKPHWNIPDPDLKLDVEKKFARWAKLNHFYAKQATAAREIFEAGEVFVRHHIRPSSWKLKVPYEIELIESEQCPIFLSTANGVSLPGISMPDKNSMRAGIEFAPAPDKRIVAYHLYREHPGETMYYALGGLIWVRIPADEISHVFKPFRAGLLRGQPHLSSTLTLLHEIGKYSDAAVVKKQIQTMFAGFISKVDVQSDILPIDVGGVTGSGGGGGTIPSPPPISPWNPYDPGVGVSKLQTGTMQELLPGETISFPTLPQDNDIETCFRVWLHQFAVGCGATYEQITGDLKGVNLSSIRAGILDFRRKCEQLQRNILVAQFAEPVACRWVKEAVIAGELDLPGYALHPEVYEDISWALPGWPWIDPVKDMQAGQMAVRSGFTSREKVCAEAGDDAAAIDLEQRADHEREDRIGVVYDTRPDKILLGHETNPEVPEEGESMAQSEVASDVVAPSNQPRSGQKTAKPTPNKPSTPTFKPDRKAAEIDTSPVM